MRQTSVALIVDMRGDEAQRVSVTEVCRLAGQNRIEYDNPTL